MTSRQGLHLSSWHAHHFLAWMQTHGTIVKCFTPVVAGPADRQGLHVGSMPRRSMSISIRDERRYATPLPFGGNSPRAAEGNEAAGHSNEENDMEESIEVVENLLESYFMQIDSSYDRLVSVGAACLPQNPYHQNA